MWRPIETAPKDGTRVLVFVPGEKGHETGILSARWVGEPEEYQAEFWLCGGVAWFDEAIHLTDPAPTHWMPLPEPP